MKILVTGGAGFVGARVVRKLVEQGREVALLLRPSSNTDRIVDLLDRCTVIQGDLRNLDASRDSIAGFEPHATLHLAWEGVRGSQRNSDIHLQNVSSAFALYNMGQSVGVEHFVGLGSQAEYGLLGGRISEIAPTKPTTLYGAAKLAAALVLERSAAASGKKFTWLRLFSSYGPGDDPNWLLPYLITSLLAGERPTLTPAEQYWDYLHVDDAAVGIISALDAPCTGIFNLGSGQAFKLKTIVESIRDEIDTSLPIGFGETPYRPDQVMHLEADISSLTSRSGWRPRIHLKDGLRDLITEYRKRARQLPR